MKRYLLLLTLMVTIVWSIKAIKPKWINNLPKEQNNTYKFVQIVSYGSNIETAHIDAIQQLTLNESLIKAVQVSTECGMLTHMNQSTINGQHDETIHEQTNINLSIKGKEITLQAALIDEYAEKNNTGGIQLTSLYMVGLADCPNFDHMSITSHYGVAPVVMSLLPGAGQWYKGDKLKGSLLFLGVASGVTGIILCDNQRASYHKKMKEQPQFAKTYNNKSNNWETARNMCIGATSIIYLYNLIDAATAKGAKQIKIRKNNTRHLTVFPKASPFSAELSMTYRF